MGEGNETEDENYVHAALVYTKSAETRSVEGLNTRQIYEWASTMVQIQRDLKMIRFESNNFGRRPVEFFNNQVAVVEV